MANMRVLIADDDPIIRLDLKQMLENLGYDVIAEADWIVDLGPEGGDGGGRVVLAAAPEEFLRPATRSHTARALREFMIGHGVK